MGLIIASVRNQRSAGATATTLTDEIKFNFTANAFHLNIFMLKLTTGAATLQQLVDKVDQFRISTVRGQPETSVDGDTLFDFLPNIGVQRFISATSTTDNDPMGFGLTYPCSPFPNDPTKNFGLKYGDGVQTEIDFSADVAGDYDNGTYDLTVEGLTADIKPDPQGFLKFVRNAYTSQAVGEDNFTKIGPAKRLLGTMNFQTTSFEDLAAAAAVNTTGIREQAVLYSSSIRAGPYKPFRSWGMDRAFPTTTNPTMLLDQGHFFSDYGINNSGSELGFNTLNANVEIRTTAGVAEATQVNPVVLV
jgi:hypothetical protein